METTVNQRVLALKSYLKLTDVEFCGLCEISTGTLHRIKLNAEISNKTLTLIVEKTNVDKEWLFNGVGVLQIAEKQNDTTWQEKAFEETRNQNEFLKKEIEWLRGLINQMSINRPQANFKSGFAGAYFLQEIGETVRVAS